MKFLKKVLDTCFVCAYKGFMNKKPVNITLPEKLVQDVKIQAVRENTTFSQIVEELLKEYLYGQKRKGNKS